MNRLNISIINVHVYMTINGVLIYPGKGAKDIVLLRRRRLHSQTSAKPTLGVWGLAPKETMSRGIFFFFQKKKQKAFVLLRRKPLVTHNAAKRPRGVGG
jgi:hypothetical protein